LLRQLNEPSNESAGRSIRIFKDIRIFSNTIKQAIDMMKQAGIEATSVKNETDEYIEYTVMIPKKASA